MRLNDASPIDESCRGFESRIERRQRIMKAPGATRSVPDRLQNRAVFLFGEAVGPGMGCLKLRPVKLRVIEPEIRGGHPRVIIPIFTRRQNGAQCTGRSEVVTEPGDAEERRVCSTPRVQLVVAGDDRGDVQPADFPSELGSRPRRNDLPGVDQLVWRIEELEPIEEERSLFRIEEREAFIQQDLPDIGFHLREIRIDRSVQRQVLPNSPS